MDSMTNSTYSLIAPLLPSYTLKPLPPLLPFISDAHLLLVLPVIAYWAYGLLFYYIDQHDLLPHYRLHTPAEFLKRNHVSVAEVVTHVLKYQALTTALGLWMAGAEPEMCGKGEYEIAVWARRVYSLRRHLLLEILAGSSVGVQTSLSPVLLRIYNFSKLKKKLPPRVYCPISKPIQ